MAYVFHMGPYLVGAACLQNTFHEAYVIQVLQCFIMRGCFFSRFAFYKYCHLLPEPWIATEMAFDRSCRWIRRPPDNRIILPCDAMIKKLFRQMRHGKL